MAGYYKEYQNAPAHKNIKNGQSKCNNMENMDTYSKEAGMGKKKVKITLEFPRTVDPKEADRFEHMLKEIYLNKIQKGYLQSRFHAVSFQPLEGIEKRGGMSRE